MNALPEEVRILAANLGADIAHAPRNARLTQSGRMRQGPSSRWMRFRAKEVVSISECRFDWRAWTGPAGVVRVRDRLEAGKGSIEVDAFGLLPLARYRGNPEITRGEAMRYLAELPWAPDAILHNPFLRWQVEAVGRFVVRVDLGGVAVAVVLSTDEEGRISEAYAPDRPRAVGKSFVPTPWRGRFGDYRTHEGRRIPFSGEVAWLIDGEEVVCWQGELQGWSAATGS